MLSNSKTIVLGAILLTVFIHSAHSTECNTTNDPAVLADIREDAQILTNYPGGWIFAKSGNMLCNPADDPSVILCTAEGSSSLVTMANDRTLVSGIVTTSDAYNEFTINPDGTFQCSSDLVNIDSLKRQQEKPKQGCEIFTDLTELYPMIEQSVVHQQLAGATLYLRHGQIDCKKPSASELVCTTDDSVEVVFQADGSPMKGIRTFGLETMELQFDADGNVGCGSLAELQRYR